ncbi:myosin phosphatase Rho-interacting protein isoform X2 [Hyperolius riggenbachi]|uniref:myosin phosphatase Rho-interacting protein isoform X2 n=1 Tax=Hyperolius riggenbachi TaxID=752182 RepID=UPI0035A29F16
MSARENPPCKKFQANIFNKSKCQNCFKPRESHLLSDQDLNQAKPIYGGWLLLAPEGTDFDNPMHRSRKWQRRFFILYEHGLLRYALDEMPTTLPQGTINMNQCMDVIDAESRTGQKYSLCILTPEEHFIRAENKEIINGWLEMLIVYPKTNKQNQKKKRKVEPPTPQEPGPAKMAATSIGIPGAEKVPATKSTLWQEEAKSKDAQDSSGSSSPLQSPVQMPSSPSEAAPDHKGVLNGDRVDSGRKTRVESGYFSLEKTKDLKTEEQPSPTPPSPSTPDAPSRYSVYDDLDQEQDPFSPPGNGLCQEEYAELEQRGPSAHLFLASKEYAVLADVPRARRISHREIFQVEKRRLEQRCRARSPGREEVARLFGQQRRRSLVIEKFEALDIEKTENMETSCSSAPASETRQGRSEKRTFPRKREETGVASIPDVSASHMSPYRRAKSLDRRSTESSMTPDLLNFKKGWLTKQYPDGQWKKHWFVLTDQNLRYYRDSVAEEAADLDGEIDLSTCYDVTEFPVQRNYGFQIHTKEGEFTLSAMTSGIRRNWIQTIMKHVRPNTAPDVTSSLPEEKTKTSSSFMSSSTQGDKQEPEHSDADGEQKRSRARDRRREGRSKTFDWAEFRPIQQALAQERAQAAEGLKSISCYDTTDSKNDLGELERERARRREERRKRFESSDSVEEPLGEEVSRMDVDKRTTSSDSIDVRPNVQVEIEQRWQQVETTPLREEKQIPIAPVPLTSSPKKYSAEDFTVLLEKQLEHSRKEVSDLLAQNLLLQQRLKEALEHQHNAPDGYILQNELADPSSEAWQRLHKVNEDLQNELEAQCQRQEVLSHQMQSLKHSYGEAKDVIRHHEAEIMNLQVRLNGASAELSLKDQALAKLKADLKVEKEKLEEMQEEWMSNEAALSVQLKASQQKLKEAESSLLEKNQGLRELEMEQALQKDYRKESQRFQEKLAGLQAQLEASEQAGMLTEERLQMGYEELLGSYEKEKQHLILALKETEDRLAEYEDKLQEKQQLMEVLQKEKINADAQASVLVHHLEEQLAERDSTIHNLEEHIKELEVEQNQLNSTCEEMAEQLAACDVSNLEARLRAQEMDCSQLRNALEESTAELRVMQECLRAKDEELWKIRETHQKVLEKKDQDINEALIKMAALGGSLEETETKLKAKEETLKALYRLNSEPQATEMENVYTQLESAKRRIAELEQTIQADAVDMFGEVVRRDGVIDLGHDDTSPTVSNAGQNVGSGTEHNTACKRQRIRFSSIQCQKYTLDGTEKSWTSGVSSDVNPEPCISGENSPTEVSCQPPGASDLDNFMSIIQTLETKLYITEEKLKEVALQLGSEHTSHQETLENLHSQWAMAEANLKEQLQTSITQVNCMAMQMEEMEREKLKLMKCGPLNNFVCCLDACVNLLTELHSADTAQFTSSTLSSIQMMLSNLIQSLEQIIESKPSESDLVCSGDGEFSRDNLPSCADPVQGILKGIHLQANVLCKMAESLKNASEEGAQEPAHGDLFLLETFANKLRLERDFWDKADELGRVIQGNMLSVAPEEPSSSSHPDLLGILSENAMLKAELSLAIQKTMVYYERMEPDERALQGEEAGLCRVTDQCSSTGPDHSSQEGLRQLLKEKAEQLRRMSSVLMSTPHENFEVVVNDILSTTQQLSICVQSCNTPLWLVWDAVAQAQICYISCKTRLEYEREARRSREALSQVHSEAFAKVHQEYQEMLQKKESELSEALEKERVVADSVFAHAEDAAVEAEAKFKEAMSQLDRSYKMEIQNLMERWEERENLLKAEHAEIAAKLHASEQEMEKVERLHMEQLKNLEVQFQDKIEELQVIHLSEIRAMEDRYTESIDQLQDAIDSYQRDYPCEPRESTSYGSEAEQAMPSDMDSMVLLKGRILELEAQMNVMREELEQKHPEENMLAIKMKYQADFDNLKATCERGFAAMEETHQKKIEDLQRQHHRELEKLRDEKERLLAEETAATISAIEAMKNAHREELERELEKTHRSQVSSLNSDVDSLRRQYLEELQSVQRELEVLSEQYSQKCLENAHLAQALEAERQALRQCQRENQELNAHNQELNNRLASEITRLRSFVTGDGGDVSPLTHGKDVYELEVLLRVKESEIQYQKQEISSLKDELQTALRDKKYASDKYKDIYTELSNVKAKAECDISRLKEQLKAATEMLGDKTPETASVSGYDIMKSKSNPDFLKNDRSSINRQLRNIRSKSLKEGLTVQERLKIFESQDYKKH